MKSIVIRVYWKDFKKLRQIFPAYKRETAASWFERLKVFLADLLSVERRNRIT